MKPQEDYRNGDEWSESSSPAGSDSSSDESALELEDAAAPARVLGALDALRRARQHFDTVLLAGGAELPAHRAVLAAASPALAAALPPAPAPRLRLDVDADALRALLDYAYTGRLRAREPAAARRLYRAAWRLRVEPARAHLAERLLRRVRPADCLELRALPGLTPPQRAALDAYIARHFADVCASGALGALPLLRVELLEGAAPDAPLALADALLAWLRDHYEPDVDLAELCARTHLLYADPAGALRDCAALAPAPGEAPELLEYRREAAERARRPAAARPPAARALAPEPPRDAEPDCAVLAAEREAGGARALLALGGRVLLARARRRGSGPSAAAAPGERARLAHGRCAHGTAALAGALLAVGGYDRARVLRSAERYEPAADAWSALPDLRVARARFPAARLGDKLYVIGGSDGHNELDSVDVFSDGKWAQETRLPAPLSYAAAAADEAAGALLVVGGWAGGAALRSVLRYCAARREWSAAPPLGAARSQAGAAYWGGALWALGGCDAWRCLASTEALRGAAWAPGPPLPTARRSVGAAAWRGQLVAAGGSDGAASLRRTEWLAPGAAAWRAGPALRRARAAAGLQALHDALYAVGGFDGKQFLACVECLYEPTGEWTSLRAEPAPPAPLAERDPESESEPAASTVPVPSPADPLPSADAPPLAEPPPEEITPQ